MNNLKKFETQAQYEAATLSYPNVSWIVSGDTVHYVKEKSTFSGLTVYYNVVDISEPTQLFYDDSGGSGSGSGGGGGVLPSAMKIDGAEVEVTNSYQFSTTGEHIVQYSFEENTIPNEYFYTYEHVTKVEIGDAITSIGLYSFGGCSSLSSVTIGNGVTSIDEYSFAACSSLTSVTIPNSVTSIGWGAFSDCSNLTSINIPSGVTSIGESVFANCSSLTSIDIPSGVTSIDNWAFNGCSGLTSIDIPNGVTSIAIGVFAGCSNLSSVTIGSGVTSIDIWVFQDCSSLTSITSLATTAPTIQSDTFQRIKANGTLYVPSGSSGYDTWMSAGDYYLGKYNWTKVEQ